jgi:RNA polymerase sigma-70 factor (ECF subfamily)
VSGDVNERGRESSGAAEGVPSAEDRRILHRFLMRYLRNAQDADDLAQEAYLRLCQLPSTEGIRKPRSYLFRVALNVFYEHRLRRSREREVLAMDSTLFEAQAKRTADTTNLDPSDALGSAELLNRVLMQIPESYRKVLVLNKRDGLTAAQIAKILGLSKRSVEVYLARALTYARSAVWK